MNTVAIDHRLPTLIHRPPYAGVSFCQFHSVEMAVQWGRKHQNLEGVSAIGVDEMQWKSGHNYITGVYQIDTDCKRLLQIVTRQH